MVPVDVEVIDPVSPQLREAIESIPDPEIPALTIEDLGVLRAIEHRDDRVVVTITPTYSGCPAMDHIERQIVSTIEGFGLAAEVRTVFTPAWSTDWMSDHGRQKLRKHGIAPPCRVAGETEAPIELRVTVRCPRCDSRATQLVSEFGSTSCKALYRCEDCLEPFDHFKDL